MTVGPKSGMHAELSHARNGLYRSLRHPILIDTGLVSARKHENFGFPSVLRFHCLSTFLVHFYKVFISFQGLHATGERCPRTVFSSSV